MSKKHNPNCPFWSPSTGNCNVLVDGIFIPLEEHVETYCKTEDHRFCKYHTKESLAQLVMDKEVSERRQFDRHAGSQQITIIQSGGHNDNEDNHLTARIVDLSKGGIRLLSTEQLSRDATVTCSLGDDFPEHLRSGSALIRWSRPLLNSSGFQAGLAFRDDILPLAVSSYLENHPL